MPLVIPIPLPNPKKPKGDYCCVCTRMHENPGTYLCLNCGTIICALSSGELCDGKVIQCHTYCDWNDRPVKCGPAVRIQKTICTWVRIRKKK